MKLEFRKEGLITLLFIAAILLAVGFFAWQKSSENKEHTQLEKSFGSENAIKYTNMDGQEISLAEQTEGVTVAIAWASWCPACNKDLITLSNLASQYQDKNIKFIAVNRAEDKTTAERYLTTVVTKQNLTLVLDPSDGFYKSINGYAMPETVVYGESGDIIAQYKGDVDSSKLQKLFDEI